MNETETQLQPLELDTARKNRYTIPELHEMFGYRMNTLYTAIKNKLIEYCVVDGLLTNYIDIKSAKFEDWQTNFHPRNVPREICALAGCSNPVQRNKAKFCSHNHYVRSRIANNEYSEIGKLGTYGKGLGQRDKSAEATAKRSKAASTAYQYDNAPVRSFVKKDVILKDE